MPGASTAALFSQGASRTAGCRNLGTADLQGFKSVEPRPFRAALKAPIEGELQPLELFRDDKRRHCRQLKMKEQHPLPPRSGAKIQLERASAGAKSKKMNKP